MSSRFNEIARALKVSSATVSRALNDKPGVGAALRQQIIEKARELNYVPNLQARSLLNSQTLAVGFFVFEKPFINLCSDPFYGLHDGVLAGFERGIAKSNYHVVFATLDRKTVSDPQSFRFVREKRIDAMVLAGPDIPNAFILHMLQSQIPLVLVDNRLEHHPVHSVYCDDEEGGYQAGQYLLSQGHRRIGVISGPRHWYSNAKRVEGYARALQEAGIAPDVVHVEETTVESGAKATQQLLSVNADITAVAAINDAMALGAMNVLREQGRHIPQDVSVIGFDDVAWAAVQHPPLTTLSVPRLQIGQEAAYRLLSVLENPQLTATETRVAVKLITRETVASIS